MCEICLENKLTQTSPNFVEINSSVRLKLLMFYLRKFLTERSMHRVRSALNSDTFSYVPFTGFDKELYLNQRHVTPREMKKSRAFIAIYPRSRNATS